MDSTKTLPPVSAISSTTLSFLNDNLTNKEYHARAARLASELETQCSHLDQSLVELNRNLESKLSVYASFTDRVSGLFTHVNVKLTDLASASRSPSSVSDGGVRAKQILGEELPALAKEVARVDMVRAYAETALKLDSLVGDIEDAVSSAMNNNRRSNSTQDSEDMRLLAIKALKQAEDILTSVTKTRPQWARLVAAVDHRVDRALAMLRPQAIADHRALLSSLGWPPPLSILASSNPETRASSEVSNPLFTMRGDLKHQYCENFLALCRLQELQRQRKSRQLEGHNRELALHQPLWAIEELVNPIAVASQRHFSKWTDQPEFIFTLVYKITRDYVDSMDELLQPLVDEALLVGYSCREEWISAMVTALLTYLAKEIFPVYVDQLDEESISGVQSQARISWLHLVDLMISFDKRIKSLVEQSGILFSLQEDGNLQKISSLSVFCDRPDWLDIWAQIELADSLEKLKHDVDDERNWKMKVQKGALLFGSEDYRSPTVSSAFLQRLSSVVDRCRSLPTVSLRSRFLRLAGAPVIQKFLDCVLLRCQEAEGMTALTDEDGLLKVANCINAAHYFESVLREWCEDVFFLEMALDQDNQLETSLSDNSRSEWSVGGSRSGIFDEEIKKLEEFRTEWVEKISVVILRGFDALSRDYVKNRRQWQEKSEENWLVSEMLVGALDYLQGKMSIIEGSLNAMDFIMVWRSLATGVDRLLFRGIFMSNAKFYDGGVVRFGCDMEVLFGVFRAWCLRPEGFFPKTSEGLKLLKMREEQLQGGVLGGEKWMKQSGITHLSVAEAEKIEKNRVFMN